MLGMSVWDKGGSLRPTLSKPLPGGTKSTDEEGRVASFGCTMDLKSFMGFHALQCTLLNYGFEKYTKNPNRFH